MKIDAYASEPQYAAHLLPIWRALEPTERGTFWAPRSVALEVDHQPFRPARSTTPTLVASFQDHTACVRRGRPSIYVEHGAGQTYEGDPRSAAHPSYSGGAHRDGTMLFLCPNERVAEANQKAYPDTPSVIVGSARVDELIALRAARRPLAELDRPAPLVAVSWHWRGRLCPEMSWAWPEYAEAILAVNGSYRLLGHAHPKAWSTLHRWYSTHQIPDTPRFEDVVEQADVYVCDNSSTIYEAAACDIPVVVVNSARYRRDIHHGLRFWEFADVGVQVDSAAQLRDGIIEALADAEQRKQRRRHIAARLYPERGRAAARAADAIRSHIA